MRSKKAAVFCLLMLFLSFVLVSCAFGNGGKKPQETTDRVLETLPFDEALQKGDENLFTVPLRHEKDGEIQYEYSYSPDGKSMSKTVYTEETPITYTVTFDDNGVPLSTEWTVVINDTRSELWRDEYDEIDGEGRITLERRYCEGDIQNAFAYTYDGEGRMETQTTRNVKQQNIIYRLLYDENGTHVGTRYQKYNGENGYYHEMKTCTYDAEGRIIREEQSDLVTEYEYTVKGGFVTLEKVTNKSGDFSWSYYYTYTYENGSMVKKDCAFEGVVTDTEYFCNTEFEHYKNAIDWIFRERLP